VLDPTAITDAVGAARHHQPEVGALVLENTHMASGGTPLDPAATAAAVDAVAGRPVHLDGARLWNATVALGVDASALAAPATTVMSCLSKGLCAPVGSLLAGPSDVIEEGRVERKRLGGAMRQAGVLAAAGLVAMRTMIERLAEDHARARRLADAVQATVAPDYDPSGCRTNVVCFEVGDAEDFCAKLAALGVLAGSLTATRVRLVTHHDVDDAAIAAAAVALASLGGEPQAGR
jgi:threonine aldolase